MKFSITSPKHGTHEVLLDQEDFDRLVDWKFYLWTTNRHTGIYVNCYSPDDKMTSKRLHRVVMEAKVGQIVDHKNGNPLDNRKENLRVVTSRVNNENSKKRRDGVTSKFKGVCRYSDGKRWKAQIQVKGIKMSLGIFTTEIEAAKAYNSAIDKFNTASPKNIV